MTIELVLPLPPKALEPNARPNRWVRARATADYRRTVKILALKARREQPGTYPLPAPVLAELTFVVANMRRDVDNCLASFKSGIDGLVDGGLLAGDSARLFDVGRPIVLAGKTEEVRVSLRGAP